VCRVAIAVQADTPSTAASASTLLLYTLFLGGRNGPCSVPPVPHLCVRRLGCVGSKHRLLWRGRQLRGEEKLWVLKGHGLLLKLREEKAKRSLHL